MAKCVQCGREVPFGFGKPVCKWCREYEAAQRGEETREFQPVIRRPWERHTTNSPLVMYAIFGMNAAVFLAMALSGVSLTSPNTGELVRWGANFGPLTLSGQWWRLLSNTFLHIGLLHIAFNMWCLWDLGTLAESLYGHVTFGVVYLIAGVAGSLASIVWHPMTVSAGASGAIFGIAGALIASFKLGEFSLPTDVIRGVLRSVVIFAGYNLVFGAISSRTDNAAHIGGMAAGLVMGALIAKVAPESGLTTRRIVVLGLGIVVTLSAANWLVHLRSFVAHTARAEQLLEGDNRQAAIVELKQALASQPDYVHARFLLAMAYGNSGQNAEAEREWKYLLERNPNDATARYNLGLTLLRENKTEEARNEFTRLMAIKRAVGAAHFGMGLTLAQENDNAAAVQEFKQAADIDPELSGVYFNLGAAYANLKRYDEALDALNKSLEYDGPDYETQSALAKVYEAKGMKDKAEDARAKAEQLKKQ